MNWLIYGHNGWIARQFIKEIPDYINIVKGTERFENFEKIKNEILTIKPDHVVVLGGLTYKSPATNIDWCEDHKQEVIRVNVLGMLNIADICENNNIHCTILGTGCIYSSLNDKEYTEEDMWDFQESFYSKTKAYTQELLKCYKNILLLRIRMPINNSNDSKNFISKLKKFEKIISIKNSMTVLPELIPVMIKLIELNKTGTWNIVNPGVISHKEIMDMYNIKKKYIDISHQSELTRVARSNNHLCVDKLMSFVNEYNNTHDDKLIVNEIHDAIKLIQNYSS